MMNGKMSTRTIREISEARGVKLMRDSEIYKLREEVKRIMWDHYSRNRSLYLDYISNYREEIIVELMKGKQLEEVMAHFAGGGVLKAG